MGYFSDLDPVRFSETSFLIKGKPLKLYNSSREYLVGIYHHIAYKLPYTSIPTVLVKGRQVEMTTTIGNSVLYFLHNYRHFYALYTYPSATQAKRFSEERVDSTLRYKIRSDVLEGLKEGTETKNVKQFSNGSTLFIYGITTEGGDNLRNLGADLLVKDEYQDLDPLAEGNVNEIISHSEFRMNIILGTPKFTGSNYEIMWDMSNKQYFFLRCLICNKDFTLSSLDDLTTGFNVRCPHCQSVEDKRNLISDGKWIATEPQNKVTGFHLTQLYVPTASKEYIVDNIEIETKKGTDTIRFTKNEVLGEFYSGIKTRPTILTIAKSYDRTLPYNVYIPVTHRIYMGIDWGGWSSVTNDPSQCFTVATIGAWDDKGRLFVNYIEIVDDPDELKQVERVAQLMNLYRINVCVADAGYGKTKNYQLQRQFGLNRFITCKYLQGSASTTFAYKNAGNVHVNRDYSLEELYADLGYGKIAIPDNSSTEWTKQHLLNFEIESIVHGGQVFRHFSAVKKENAKTDFAHSLNYLRIAAFLEEKKADGLSPLAAEAANVIPRPILVGPGSELVMDGHSARGILIQKNRNLTN